MKRYGCFGVVAACMVAILLALAGAAYGSSPIAWGFEPVPEPTAPVAPIAWGFAPIEPQEVVCVDGVCTVVESAPTVSEFAPVVYNNLPMQSVVYSQAGDACPCGCGIVGCNCSGGAMVFSAPVSTRMSWLASHLSSDHGIDVSGMSEAQMEAVHNSLHGGGYGVFGLRSQPVLARGSGYGLLGIKPRPWGWRIRAFFRR